MLGMLCVLLPLQSLNIKGHKSVQECLESYLSAEVLEGENKYFCDHCASKERAERYIELDPKRLPQTITLQLMRFVYDAQAGRKKKLMVRSSAGVLANA